METWEKQRGKPLAEKGLFSRAERAGQGHRARHRQHARRSVQPDLPDADLGDRQRRRAGTPDQRLLRSRSAIAEGADRCGRARRRCDADPARPFRLRQSSFMPAARTIPRCSKAASGSTSDAGRCCIPRQHSSTASGRASARPTSTGAAFSTTTRSMRWSWGVNSPQQMQAMFARDLEASEAIDAGELGTAIADAAYKGVGRQTVAAAALEPRHWASRKRGDCGPGRNILFPGIQCAGYKKMPKADWPLRAKC